jgi:hypothetical protein
VTSSYLERYSTLTYPIFFHRDDRRESELLPVDFNQGFGFLTNRLEGYRARFKIGLERSDSFDDDSIDNNMLDEPPQDEIPLGESLAVDV